jgi:hypothetical protein
MVILDQWHQSSERRWRELMAAAIALRVVKPGGAAGLLADRSALL